MDSPIYRYCKVGIVHFKAFPEVSGGIGPIWETIEKIATDDFFTASAFGRKAGRIYFLSQRLLNGLLYR